MKRLYTSLPFTILLTLCITSIVHAQSYVPVWNDARIKVKPAADIKAYAFDLKDVRLSESPFTKAMQADVNYLLKIEPDRLLSDFRTHFPFTILQPNNPPAVLPL
ncbi:MAG: hypothetical protein WKG06_43345 [Segetibacter sp.]